MASLSEVVSPTKFDSMLAIDNVAQSDSTSSSGKANEPNAEISSSLNPQQKMETPSYEENNHLVQAEAPDKVEFAHPITTEVESNTDGHADVELMPKEDAFKSAVDSVESDPAPSTNEIDDLNVETNVDSPEDEAKNIERNGYATTNGNFHSNGHVTAATTNGNSFLSNEDTSNVNGLANTNGHTSEANATSKALPRLPTAPTYQSTEDPGPTRFKVHCHPNVDSVLAETDAYFLDNWPFQKESDRQAFILAEPNRWACLAFSMAKDDRIAAACKVNTLLFLLDDLVEDMNVEEGKAFYEQLIGIARGKLQPSEGDAVQEISHEIWQVLRAKDEKLADDVLDGAILCLKAQVDPRRLNCTNMKKLLEYRGEEGGVLFVANLMCWSMGLHLSAADFKSIPQIFTSYSNLGMVVNDVLSFDKELRVWEAEHKEGAQLLNIVDMLSDNTGLSHAAAKRVLWVMVREWELNHQRLVEGRLVDPAGCSDELKTYMDGLGYLLAGNEVWSWTTGRYHELSRG